MKEFKEFDKKYSASKGKLMGYELSMQRSGNFDIRRAVIFTGWGYAVGQYTNEEIRHAVYFAEGAEDWQEFRVSQKGFSTKEKLYRLEKRWLHYCSGETSYPNQEVLSKLEQLRINNYIGALVRGGQLSTTHMIQR